MSRDFEELDYRKTPMGELTLRRRRVALLDGLEVFEVKLGEAFLMSSLFHVVEDALADLGLGACVKGDWNVVVGGLGLGYTAVAALAHVEVRSLVVIDVLEAVIEWHQGGLVPLGAELVADPRCRLVHVWRHVGADGRSRADCNFYVRARRSGLHGVGRLVAFVVAPQRCGLQPRVDLRLIRYSLVHVDGGVCGARWFVQSLV